MNTSDKSKRLLSLIILLVSSAVVMAQPSGIRLSTDGLSYFKIESNEVIRYSLPANTTSTFISKSDLTPVGQEKALPLMAFNLSPDAQKVLIYTNSKKSLAHGYAWRLLGIGFKKQGI